MTFSKMLQKVRKHDTIEGNLEGICCICGEKTTKGHKKKFGANFTSADIVSSGDVICEYCKHLVDNSNEYRRTMFLLSENEFKKFKKNEAKEIVLNLPKKPFYLYLTKTWQKIGWTMISFCENNGSNDLIILVDYDIIHTSLLELKNHFKIIEFLRELKIPKTALETGVFEPHHFKKVSAEMGLQGTRKLINNIKSYANNPSWDLAVYLND